MSVTSLVPWLDSLACVHLNKIVAEDDEVTYAVTCEDHFTECEHGDAAGEAGVGFFLCLVMDKCEEYITTVKASWTMSAGDAMTGEKFLESIQQTWDELQFSRMAYSLRNDELLTESDGEGSDS